MATPIGNLEDITLRALRILKKADLIVCEDTRVTKKLLQHYNIKKPLFSYHQHSRLKKSDFLMENLKTGKNIALVTDAGTPGISDPGNKLVEEASKNGFQITPIPGASALSAIVSAAGINLQKFVFFGFPPHKKGRETFFREIASAAYPVIYFESPRRILKNLEFFSKFGDKQIIVGRELTKMFEEIIRGNAAEIAEHFARNPEKLKGELTVVIF